MLPIQDCTFIVIQFLKFNDRLNFKFISKSCYKNESYAYDSFVYKYNDNIKSNKYIAFDQKSNNNIKPINQIKKLFNIVQLNNFFSIINSFKFR